MHGRLTAARTGDHHLERDRSRLVEIDELSVGENAVSDGVATAQPR